MVLPQNSAESLILPSSTWHEQLTYPELDTELNFSKAKEILEFLGFEHVLNKQDDLVKVKDSWNKYSGGEKQRILLGRVLYQKPNYCILDEAFSNLDLEWKKKILTRFRLDGIIYMTIGHDDLLKGFHDDMYTVEN